MNVYIIHTYTHKVENMYKCTHMYEYAYFTHQWQIILLIYQWYKVSMYKVSDIGWHKPE